MSPQIKKFTKMVKDTLRNGINIDENKSIREIVEECENNNKLFIYKHIFICPVKTIINGIESLRIIFAIKEENLSKIQNAELITNIVKDMENILIYLTSCKQTKIDKFIYLDIIKQFNE